MIYRRFLTIAALAAYAAIGVAAPRIPPADEAVLKAYDAFRAGDAVKLQRSVSKLGGHVLSPYFEYWRLKLLLEDMPDADVLAFLEKQSGSYLADRLRADWLKGLGKRGDWQSFDRELPPLVQDDLEIRCYAWLSRLARADESAYEEARAIWLEPRELPENCHALADRMSIAGRFTVDDVWRRTRLLFENGQLSAARRALAHLPAGDTYDPVLLNQAATAPKRLLANLPRSLERRATREMVLFAVARLGRSEPVREGRLARGRHRRRAVRRNLRATRLRPEESARWRFGARRLAQSNERPRSEWRANPRLAGADAVQTHFHRTGSTPARGGL